jgi:hypothetical protein
MSRAQVLKIKSHKYFLALAKFQVRYLFLGFDLAHHGPSPLCSFVSAGAGEKNLGGGRWASQLGRR